MDASTIDRLSEDEFPHDELDEMDAIEHGLRRALRCCRSIPCRYGACEEN